MTIQIDDYRVTRFWFVALPGDRIQTAFGTVLLKIDGPTVLAVALVRSLVTRREIGFRLLNQDVLGHTIYYISCDRLCHTRAEAEQQAAALAGLAALENM